MPYQKFKRWLFNLFYFNKQERNGIFILCLLLGILVLAKLLLPMIADSNYQVQLLDVNPLPDTTSLEAFKPSAKEELQESRAQSGNYSSTRFVFNPNTVSMEDLRLLGFSEKLATTCLKFRSKGGKFFKPSDLKKLYGLSPNLYAQLEPYILIPHTEKSKYTFKKDSAFAGAHYPARKTYTKTLVEINSADSLSIVYLKGIGPGFTKRILKYRALLGGFHSVDQLKEIWGMTDSLFNTLKPQIMINSEALTKIPINSIDLNSLKKHPYFSFQSATAIINYKNKHGRLTEADIKGLGIFSPEKLALIMPYLQY